MGNFRQIDRETEFLLPPSVDERLPARHLARFVVEVIKRLDLSAIVRDYRGSSSAAYPSPPPPQSENASGLRLHYGCALRPQTGECDVRFNSIPGHYGERSGQSDRRELAYHADGGFEQAHNAQATTPRISNKLWWISAVTGLLGVLLTAGCDSNDPMMVVEPKVIEPVDVVTTLTSTTNPTGYAPLTAEIHLTTSRPVQVEIFVPGQNTEAGDVRHRFEETGESFTLPVLGLYPTITNTVSLHLFEPNGALLEEVSHDIIASPLQPALPPVTVNTSIPNRMTPGMNLVNSYFGVDGKSLPHLPLMFDAEGAIRWYIDFSDHPSLSRLFYDTGLERLANGNLYFGDRTTDRIIEIDMLGRILNEWPLPGYGFHHDVIEMPNGNFLVTVNKNGLSTAQDHILEIDRTTGAPLQVWDLNQALDNQRRTWARNNRDWFHSNGIVYDETDDTIIVSGRTQGTVKLTRNNEVVWILAPHRDWMTAGNGADLNTYLLQPLDASGQPITDPDILDGSTNHPDFEWAWYQHAPELMPDGTLLLFDNGV